MWEKGWKQCFAFIRGSLLGGTIFLRWLTLWQNSFYCPPPFFSCLTFSDRCCRRTVLTSSCQHWQSETTWSVYGSKANQKTHLIWKAVPKWERIYPLVCRTRHIFFLSTLMLLWTFQPSFEIGMDTSIRSICNSMTMALDKHSLSWRNFQKTFLCRL